MNVWLKRILLVAAGALAGYGYYFFIGCVSGTCPMASNPYASTAYGAAIGALLAWDKRQRGK